MTTHYPGALWRPIQRNYTAAPRSKTRGVILHVAVSEAKTLQGWFNNPAARASSHLYIRRDGTVEQYVDMDYKAWTSGAASDNTIGVETQGMGHGAWTTAQVNALIDFLVWASARYGFPLQVMKSSKATETGIGWHAQGVPANANQKARGISQTGGQLWSSSVGKICPGPDRIAQIPALVTAAAMKAGKKTATTTPAATPAPAHPTPVPALSGLEKVTQDMDATHVIFEFQEGKGTALGIAAILPFTWSRFTSTEDFKAALTVLKRTGAKVKEWKEFKTGKNPNNMANPAAFGREVK